MFSYPQFIRSAIFNSSSIDESSNSILKKLKLRASVLCKFNRLFVKYSLEPGITDGIKRQDCKIQSTKSLEKEKFSFWRKCLSATIYDFYWCASERQNINYFRRETSLVFMAVRVSFSVGKMAKAKKSEI